MKELSIEEKARNYDEVYKKVAVRFGSNVADEIFLKESEGERIRKALIDGFKRYNDRSVFNGCLVREILSWLEKQGEQNPTDKVEHKFKVGDWIIHNKNIELANSLMLVNGKYNNKYLCKYIDGQFSYNIEFIDKNYHLWTIQDAKDGDVLVASDGSIFLFKCTIDCACKHYVALTDDGVVNFNEGLEHYWETSIAVHPATKEQRDTLMKAMADEGYTFDFEKKELKKIEQNTAWSEEDEVGLANAMWSIKQAITIAKDENDMGNLWYAERWLNSLKDRVQQQPKQEWKQENTDDLTDFENAMMHIGNSFFGEFAGLDPNDTNAIKEQASLLSELVPKQEWSEEDSNLREATIGLLNLISPIDAKSWGKSRLDCIEWLKSLKDRVQPQKRWKPSDEQIKVCKEVYADILSAKGFDLGTVNGELNRLEAELKKL